LNDFYKTDSQSSCSVILFYLSYVSWSSLSNSCIHCFKSCSLLAANVNVSLNVLIWNTNFFPKTFSLTGYQTYPQIGIKSEGFFLSSLKYKSPMLVKTQYLSSQSFLNNFWHIFNKMPCFGELMKFWFWRVMRIFLFFSLKLWRLITNWHSDSTPFRLKSKFWVYKTWGL